MQDLICQAYNTSYEIERWQLPDGTYIEGQLPLHIQGHYGVVLRAHIMTIDLFRKLTEPYFRKRSIITARLEAILHTS